MKKLASFLVLVALFSPFFRQPAQAFNMTVAPAKKVFEMNRGESKDYTVIFRNDFDSDRYRVRVVDFVYNESGVRNFIEATELADPGQSLTTWVTIKTPEFEAVKGKDNAIPVSIQVPDNASYGDHFGVILIEKAISQEAGDAGPVTVGGSIASVVAVKVLGGQVIKSGGLVDYQIETQERARNTANFVIQFNNTGNEFFTVLAEIAIFENASDSMPIKTLSRDFTIFPNVVREIKVPLGDLGDDFGEKEYLSRLTVYEFYKGQKVSQMASSQKSFQYYIPVSADAEVHYVAKEVVVTPSIVEIVKELGLYIAGFLVLLIVLIRVLFSARQPVATAARAPRKKRK
ncbi:MAG: hypothetical protein AB7J46_00470 [Candidatus Altimarinota bacterium]